MDCLQIARQIIQTYNNNFSSLDLLHQSHFATRMWRISGQEKYIKPIKINFQKEKVIWSNHIKNLEKIGYPRKIGSQILGQRVFGNLRWRKKQLFYPKNPENLFYIELINYLFHLKSFGGEVDTSYLRKLNLEKIFMSKNQILFDPSETANSISYLKFLKVADFENEFQAYFLNFWLSLKEDTRWLNFNKIYGLTHLIIADSWFYQKFVKLEKFKAVFDYFQDNLDQIIDGTNSDIIAEVGVCFRLAGESPPALGKIKNYLISCYDKRLGYIPRKGKGFQAAEHRNIAAVLVLADYDKLYSGPNLAKYL